MNCIICGSTNEGITVWVYGVRVRVCGLCVGRGRDKALKAARRLVKKRAPKVFKALAGVATISKLLRRDA